MGRTAATVRPIGVPAAGRPAGAPRRARARRRPSCMACTRGTGMARPSSIRSAGSRCGGGISPVHGSRCVTSAGTVRMVKSAGVTDARSSQATGKETGTPGRSRGLYTDTTVAPPVRVGSTKTLPPRSSRMKAVVASAGSSRSARTARARVAAANSSASGPGSTGTKTCTPLAPLVFTAPASPASARACRTSSAAATPAANPPPSGGSRSSTRWVVRLRSPTVARVGWYSTARWLANQSRVRRSSQSAYAISRRDASAQIDTRDTQSGVYRGRFFCMNCGCPGRTRTTDSGRPRNCGTIRSATASR